MQRSKFRNSPGPILFPVVRRLALILAPVAYCWALAVFAGEHPHFNWKALTPPMLVLLAAVLQLLMSSHLGGAGVVFLSGLAGSALLTFHGGDEAAGSWLAIAVTLATGMTLGFRAAVLAAVALVGASFAGPQDTAMPWLVTRNVGLALAVIWVLGDTAMKALVRLEESEGRAWRCAADAMEQRARLQRAHKDLRGMYQLLERTNHELDTARREAQEARDSRLRFAAGISHELCTPVTLILGFSRMMYRSPEVYGDVRWTPELRADVRQIHQASQHILGLMDDVLDLSRSDLARMSLRLEPTDLSTVILCATSTARNLIRRDGLELTVSVPSTLPMVTVDQTRIRQILLNLLTNAARFTERGVITVRAYESDGEVHIAVSDTGSGIAPNDLPHIFDEFSQVSDSRARQIGGTGLGLAVCRRFVEMHGGRITVDSELGLGSTFEFTIPVPDTGRARSRLSFFTPESWQASQAHSSLTRTAVVLATEEAASHLVAAQIPGYRSIPVVGTASLAEVVSAYHPDALVLVTSGGVSPATEEEIWSIVGRRDLGIISLSITSVQEHTSPELLAHSTVEKPIDLGKLEAAFLELTVTPTRALVIGDDPGLRSLIKRSLSHTFPGIQVVSCADGVEALAHLEHNMFSLVLMDLATPRMDGAQLLRQARDRGLLTDTHVIIISGKSGNRVSDDPTVVLSYARAMRPRDHAWSSCLSALIGAAPPDYSRSATGQ